MISDPRFARLHTDARFQVFPNKQRKVEIDERFKGVPSTGSQVCICSSSADVRIESGSMNIHLILDLASCRRAYR